MVKAIIFDIGGVLIRTVDPAPRAQLEQRLGLKPGEAEYIVYNSDQGRRAQLGAITAREQWAWVQRRLQLTDAGLEEFRTAFWAGDRVDHTLLDLIRSLRTDYQMAIISNAMDDLHDVVARLDPAGDLFEVITGSAYERVMKPDAIIFERTLARLGRAATEAVFIDDMPANVAGARAIGLAAIHFRPGLDLAAELAQLGVRVGE